MLTTIRKGLALIGPGRRRRFLLVGALAVIVSGLEAVAALLVLVLLQLILEPGAVPELPVIGDIQRFFPGLSYDEFVLWSSALFAVFFLARGLLFLLQHHALARVSENTGVLLADRLVDGYLSMPYAFHLRRNSAELVRNAYDNVQQIVRDVFKPLSTLIAELTLTAAILLVLLVASLRATAIAVVVMGGVVALTLGVIQPRLKAHGRRRQRAARSALQHLQQGLGGLRDIKVLGKEAVFSRDFRRVRSQMSRAQYQRDTLAYVPRVTMEATLLLLILGALVLAVTQDAVGGVLATLGVFAYAGLRLQPSLQKITQAFNSLRFTEAAVDDLAGDLALLDARRSARALDDRSSRRLPLRRNLEVRDVWFRYEGADRAALRGINLTIRRGESIGIAGATGGGKTTLLDILCGLLEPTTGAVLVDGADIRAHLRAWQRSLGVVHQNSFLLDDTIARNIALGEKDDATDEQHLARCIEIAQLTDVVANLPDGVHTPVGERGVRLSGGQRQRITLARALYRKPEVLILDEGTAALDNDTERAVIEGLNHLAGETTVIMVAHRLTTIERCDRIVFLENGEITAIGPFGELVHHHEGFRRMSAGLAG